MIKDVGKYNDKGLGNPFKRSCGSGCHNTLLMGMDLAPGYMDLGLNNLPWANTRPDLPLFKVVCNAAALPQSYLGRVIYTHDPARALVTGKCADVGASMTQQSRGLAARAPYFMNGSAATLRELVDFYDRRFNIGYTETEKRDLVNFLSVL
jgi:cytochrome c peroxidase